MAGLSEKFNIGASRKSPAKRDVAAKDGPTIATSVKMGLLERASDFLKLTGEGSGDVVRNYRWGINSSRQLTVDEVPVMILTEFQTTAGPLQDNLTYFGAQLLQTAGIAGNAFKEVSEKAAAFIMGDKYRSVRATQQRATENEEDAYAKMYTGEFTENVYRLPYFSSYNHSISNTWAEGGVFEKVTETISKAGGVLGNSYTTVAKRRIFQSTDAGNIETSFQLFNTLSDDPMGEILKNYNLIRVLQHNNMPGKTSAFNMVPPVIYQIDIPGIRYSPVAYISTLVIENIGQVNNVPLKLNWNSTELTNVNVPDAWGVTLQFTEMLPETRNIFAGVSSASQRSKVTVLDDVGGSDGSREYKRNYARGI